MLVYLASNSLIARVALDAGFFFPKIPQLHFLSLIMLQDYLPAFLQLLAALAFAGSALGLSVLLGKRGSHNETKETPYECGMLPIGDGAPRFSVKFYLVAMLFVLFDIEVVFMYPWAVQFSDLVKENTMALWSMAGFASLLAFAYVYALKKGALNWKS